jgi:hypothetical protein
MNQRWQRSAVFFLCVGVLAGASGVRGGQVDLLFDMGPAGQEDVQEAILSVIRFACGKEKICQAG